MILQDLILNFRKQVQDLSAPFLWDEDEALIYAIDAQDVFVRRMGGISDNGNTGAGTALTDLSLVTAQPTSAFSPFVLKIRSGKLLTAKRDVEIIDESQVKELAHRHDYGMQTASYLDDSSTGTVRYGIIGLEDNRLRWYKVPSEADTCRLHVYRLPYPRITEQEDDLEIPEYHHYHLIKWMKHLAYSKEDAETYDKDLADKNEAVFEKYCDTAKSEFERQRYKPRVVAFNAQW